MHRHPRCVEFSFCLLLAIPGITSAQICNPGEVRAVDSNGTELVFGTIQAAVDAADSGWKVIAGPGLYSEVVVVDLKTDLSIATECGAIVGGFRLKRSSQITLQGFEIDASGTGESAITLLGGINRNDNVIILNNDIHDAGNGQSGVSVARDNSFVNIQDNRIHDNARNGVVFIDSTGGPNFVSSNTITGNGWNGVRVNRQHLVTLTNNNLSGNGIASGSTGGRYGVLRERASGSGQPEGITLLFNRIEGNQGNVVLQQSSTDLGNYDQMLDASDSGNITTSGAEAAATGLLLDCNLFDVWQTMDDFQLVPGQNALTFPMNSIAIDTHPNPVVNDGNVYVAGYAHAAPGIAFRHGIVRKSQDGGLTWRIVRDIPPVSPNPSVGYSVTNDATGTVYLASGIGTSTQVRWTLETSDDQGATWQQIDSYLYPSVASPLGNFGAPFDILVLNDTVFATGHANDENGFFRWVTRRKQPTDTAFVTVDSHDQEGTPASPVSIFADSFGNVFAAGAIWSPGFRWTVRSSTSGAVGTWSTVDQFSPPGGGQSNAVGIVLDSTDNILVAGDGGSPRKAYVRRSAPGGQSWEPSPLYEFQLSSSSDTFVLGFEKDAAGNLYLLMKANDAVTNHWIVQKSTDDGQTFTTIDDFLFPGLASSGAHSFVEGQVDDRSFYVAGEAGDLGAGTSRWVVRKLPCLSPRALTTFGNVAAASGQGSHSCAVDSSGSAQCWGNNSNGQVGSGQGGSIVPAFEFAVDVPAPVGVFTEISTGTLQSCGVIADSGFQKVYCWGGNSFGERGDNDGADHNAPVAVAATDGISVSVSAGNQHTCALIDGQIACWGRNSSGQLGLGDQVNRSTPTFLSLSPGLEAIDVSAGFAHSCAVVSDDPLVETDNEVLCWGSNTFGAIGVTGPLVVTTPTIVPGAQGATRVTTGSHLSCALIDQGVRCWGRNDKAQLGRGTLSVSSPDAMDVLTLEPGAASGVVAIDAGDEHVCAIVRGGLQCWGNNQNGELGDNRSEFTASSPVQVAGYGPGSGLLSVSAGWRYTCASNGYPTCWGDGASFKRGDGLGTSAEFLPHPVLQVP